MSTRLTLGSAAGRWVIAATALGSGLAFLDSTVVNVALPTIRRDLGGGLSVQQWVLDGYLLTLGSLLLLGGALGDRYGRRKIFLIGLAWFSIASLGCGLAPTSLALVVLRAVQGVGAALLVPGSLALINALVTPDDRGRAIGIWAGLSGVATAVGPLLGGWLTQSASWRWVFFINLPIAAAAGWATGRRLPESRGGSLSRRLDPVGAVLICLGLAAVIFTLIELPLMGWGAPLAAVLAVGLVCLAGFFAWEARAPAPMLPLSLFGSRQFSGANLTTVAVYAALNGAMFLLALQLQQSMDYSPLAAGAAMLPITVLMLLLSPRAGALGQRIGARLPMAVGPVVAAVGLAMMVRVSPGAGYLSAVLPAVVVFGLGLSATVAPLTSAVLGAVGEERAGLASGINNAVARVAGLFAVALLPLLAGINTGGGPLGPEFGRAMLIAAAACALGGAVAALTIPGRHPAPARQRPDAGRRRAGAST